MVVFDMVVQVVPPFVEYSHLITLPVSPDNVSVPLLLPEHTVALPLTEPPTETGSTVSITAVRFLLTQPVVVFLDSAE